MIRKLLVLVLLAIVGVVVAGDVFAKRAAESAIESEVRKRATGIVGVEARITSFPFVGRLVAQGKVSKLELSLDDVSGHGVNVANLDVVARDIVVDRAALLGGNPRLPGLRSMTVTATISEATVRQLVPSVDVRLLDGKVAVTASGQTRDATASVEGGRIVLRSGNVPVPFGLPVPGAALLPCPPEVRVVPGALELWCTATSLPKLVADAVGTATLRD